MFKISYFNVGELMVTKDKTVAVTTLGLAKELALKECSEMIPSKYVTLKPTDAIYLDVLADGELVGGVTIQKI